MNPSFESDELARWVSDLAYSVDEIFELLLRGRRFLDGRAYDDGMSLCAIKTTSDWPATRYLLIIRPVTIIVLGCLTKVPNLSWNRYFSVIWNLDRNHPKKYFQKYKYIIEIDEVRVIYLHKSMVLSYRWIFLSNTRLFNFYQLIATAVNIITAYACEAIQA